MTERTSASSDAVGLGVLRAAITVLVVLHHAALAYHPFAPPPFDSLRTYPFWQAFPVVDADRWSGAQWIVAVNDTFFMSLMFLISGVFVWRSLARQGAARYLAARARRLGLPFLAAAALLAPLAYLPAYLQTSAHDGFWHEWLSLSSWPAGPAWFLWLLLAFNVLVVALHGALHRALAGLGRVFARSSLAAFAILVVASAAAYVPMALAHGTLGWTAVGPFAFQTCRVIHYAVYFLAGVAIGSGSLDAGVVARTGRLATRWAAWLIAAALAFALAYELAVRDFASGGARAAQVADDLGFVVACAALSFAFLAGFLRVAWPRSGLLTSLRRNAYAIYVLHYAFVSWLQYALLDAALPAPVKLALVFTAALGLSWATAAGVRRMLSGAPLVADPA